MSSHRVDPVVIDGRSLTIEQIIRVARHAAPVAIAPAAARRVERCRAVVDALLAGGEQVRIYGLTTGFGSKRDVDIPQESLLVLQENLIRSHSCGVGPPLHEDVARAMMLLRANTLVSGHSGVRLCVVERLVEMLNKRVYPYVPCKGSLGASGDLAPLSHLALVLIGDPAGKVYPAGFPRESAGRGGAFIEQPVLDRFVPSTTEYLRSAFRFEPLRLHAKEGLAINNGTTMMAALGACTLFDAERFLAGAELAAAMTLDAIKGVPASFGEELMALRPQPGQGEAARNILSWAAGSDILRVPLNMAHLGSARRNLADVRAALAGSPSPAVAAVLPGVNQLDATLARLAKDPVALLTRPALEAEEMRREFRALLAEVKRGLTEQYRALLNVEAHLPPEAIAVFDLMTSAIHHLEQAAPRMPRVQDDYSLRCAPQVLGAVRATLEHARRVIVAELNAVVDNPIIFPPPADEAMPLAEYAAMIRSLGVAPLRRLVVGGGNFHGEPLGLAMDSLTAALSEAASISERRTASMVDKGHSNGLPSFLIHESGLNCGFMILQYTAAALVSENKTLCYPATVDSIPTCENTEDHVSMGGIAARKCREVLENAEMVVAIEILAAWQAIHFRAPLRPGAGARRVADILRERGIAFYSADRVPYPDIEEVTRLLRAGALTAER